MFQIIAQRGHGLFVSIQKFPFSFYTFPSILVVLAFRVILQMFPLQTLQKLIKKTVVLLVFGQSLSFSFAMHYTTDFTMVINWFVNALML